MERTTWKADYSWIPVMDCTKTYVFEWVSQESRKKYKSSNVKYDTQELWIEYYKKQSQWYSFECFWTAEEHEQMINEILSGNLY